MFTVTDNFKNVSSLNFLHLDIFLHFYCMSRCLDNSFNKIAKIRIKFSYYLKHK